MSRRLPSFLVAALAALASAAAVASMAGSSEAADKKPAAGPAKVGAVPANGKLKREEFETALSPYLKDMHDCYEKALNKDALAEGQVVLMLDTQNGKVIAADTDRDASTMKLEDAHKCIIGVLLKMKMPLAKNDKGEHDPKAVASIRYPVEFSLGIDVDGASATVTGAKLDYDRVKKVFFYNKLAIGRCYLDAMKAKKGAAAVGKLMMKVTVVGGTVTASDEVKDTTTITDAELKKCILTEVKAFKFPTGKNAKGDEDPKAESVIQYPIDLK